MHNTSPIGFFDSGLGGISVLRGTRELLPGEDYLYFGDSCHAPYGVRSLEEVRELSLAAAAHLLERGAKAVVIACNTATSAAAACLREVYPEIPIIGTEPAVKPAVERHPGGRILVMATPRTLQEKKFLDLWALHRDRAEIVPVPCGGLMEFVEQGILRGEEPERFLRQLLTPYVTAPVDAVVLGCTHYPFLKPVIRRVIGPEPEILDGAEGVARQLGRRLEELDLRNPRKTGGTVTFENSLNSREILDLSRLLLNYRENPL